MTDDWTPNFLGRWACLFGLHRWSIWRKCEPPFIGYQERRCVRCGHYERELL